MFVKFKQHTGMVCCTYMDILLVVPSLLKCTNLIHMHIQCYVIRTCLYSTHTMCTEKETTGGQWSASKHVGQMTTHIAVYII